MGRRILRWLLVAAYVGALFVVLGVVSYASFSLFVRRGAIPAPDFVGLSLEEARVLGDEAGLRIFRRAEEDRYDEQIPAGHVVEQDPPAGRPLKHGGRLQIVLSRGFERIGVPDLRGQAVRAAQAELAVSGLPEGTIASLYWPGGAPGTVVDQRPPPGAEVDPAAPVELLVALDDPQSVFVMPDLVYRDADAVRRFFEARGFQFGSIKFEPYEGVEEGIILRHTPLAGHPLRRSDSITLVVATRLDT